MPCWRVSLPLVVNLLPLWVQAIDVPLTSCYGVLAIMPCVQDIAQMYPKAMICAYVTRLQNASVREKIRVRYYFITRPRPLRDPSTPTAKCIKFTFS